MLAEKRAHTVLLLQLAIFTMVNPPQPGGASYDTFHREKEETLSAFAERAELVTKLFNDIPHIHCNPVQGAMYAFPRLELPAKYIQEAKVSGFIFSK